MTVKFDTFMSELKELCEKHKVYISCPNYYGDYIGVYPESYEEEKIYKYDNDFNDEHWLYDRIVDCTDTEVWKDKTK